jgi:hypothetical protein
VDKELAALKAEIGPGSPAPPELAGAEARALQLALGTLRRLVAENFNRPGRVAVRR